MQKIFLVEDDEILAEVLEKSLVAENFQVVVVTDGALAFDKLHEVKPDLVILDILLPGTNGWMLLAQCRRHTDCFCQKVPTIILTNLSLGRNDQARAKDLAIIDYLVKANFTPKEIVARIKKLFRTT